MTFKHDTQVGGSHYDQGDKPQHWDLAIMYGWDPFQYQITKYVMRWKDKHPTFEARLEDLKKTRSFLNKYIANAEKYDRQRSMAPTTVRVLGLSNDANSDENFQCEGYLGNETQHYKCRRCGTAVIAKDLLVALLEHGECPGRGYTNQG